MERDALADGACGQYTRYCRDEQSELFGGFPAGTDAGPAVALPDRSYGPPSSAMNGSISPRFTDPSPLASARLMSQSGYCY
jgi:hypothetical protein